MEDILKNVSGMYNELAEITGNKVWCRTCRREEDVDAGYCWRHGWPKCCGHTMTIDHPSKWSNI